MKTPTPQLLPSGKYFVRVRVGGSTYSKTFDNQTDAETWALLTKTKYKAGEIKKARPEESKTIRTLILQYLDENNLALNTRRSYTSLLNNHFTQILDKPYNSVSNWQRAVNLELQTLNPNTVSLYWGKIRAVLKYFDLDVPTVKIPSKSSRMKNYLTADEIPRFCEAIKGNRYEYLFLLMLSSLRVSEALGVKKEDVTEKGIYVHGTKTDAAERFVPFMIPRLKELFYVPVHTSTEQLNRELKRICSENDFPVLSCHSLRVSFASLCYQKNVPSRVVMKIAGWNDIQTMHRIYVRISDNEIDKWADELRTAF